MNNNIWFTTPTISINLNYVASFALKNLGILFNITSEQPILVTFDTHTAAENESIAPEHEFDGGTWR
ncbi:MAG TPA: hypothetical protein PKH93_08470 [Chitinophagales bacterium]|nr:hypothetical protein [Chitinophagales bacterium]